MRRVLFFVFLLLSLSLKIWAQTTYGNEWINYSQKYYKIKITQNGVYRINYNTLAAAGILAGVSDPRNFQIFNNGVQQQIYIQGENDGVFNTQDFIEFYAQHNDGSQELPVYTNTSFVPNPYYSLINDTAVYFLTWNSSINNARMTPETDVSFSSYTPINYFFKQEVQAYSSTYYNGPPDVSGETDPRYVNSEGYFDSQTFSLGASEQKNVPTTNLYASGPYAILETVAIGASQDFNTLSHGLPDHHLNIQFKSSTAGGYTLFKDTLFQGFTANKFMSIVSPTLLGSSTTTFNFTSVADAGLVSNSTVVSYIKITYPHTLDLEGANSFVIYLPDNSSQVKSYLNITDFVASDTVRLYNLTNGTRVTVVQNGSNYDALIANTGLQKKCFITSDGYIGNVTTLQPVTPSAQFTNFATQAADSTFIIVYNKLLSAAANSYKNYRSTNLYGGHHNVIMADINELYDQFAYGIVLSPLSIRQFSNYLIKTYPSPPQNLLLFGKSINMYVCRQTPANYVNNLVCSYGGASNIAASGSSDVSFTLGLNGGSFHPAIPTGRLSAQSDSSAMLYLTKIQEYENQLNNPPAEWKKQVLHFGGGNNSEEQNAFRAYLNAYQDTIEGVYYGGNVTSFFKTSSAPIEITTSSTLTNFIDNGVSLMTFFGHASGNGFDQSIDDINSYNPIAGHYPFVVGNGCFSGDIHQPTTYSVSTSESYVLSSKGVVGYLGSVTEGIPYALNDYSQEWYNQLSRKSYNKSIGVIMQQTMNVLAPIAAVDPVVSNNCLVETLEGDPSIKINSELKPDYEITTSDIYFNTQRYSDSVIVYVINTNIGMAIKDTIFTQLVWILPNGTSQTYLSLHPAPYYKDTIKFTLFLNPTTDVGLNQFKVTLDAYNQVNELSKSNNVAEATLLINGTGIIPVYPYKFAIVPTDTVTLKASTINPFEKAQNYVFEFDTIDTYNSPFAQRTKIASPGGVVKWKPPVKFTDSTVYYWRVSPDSTNKANGFIWYESSFQYIPNQTGWEQAHFFQFKNDGYQYVQFNRPKRNFTFSNTAENVQCHNLIAPPFPNPLWATINWKVNGAVINDWNCNNYAPDISVAVFNPINASNILSPIVPNPMSGVNNGIYGECHCRDSVQRAFDFLVSTPAQRNYLTNFLNNSAVVPKGYYVLIYSMNAVDFPLFEPALVQAFQSVGSAQITSIPPSVPYILWGRKGDPIGSATEIVGSTSSSVIDLNTTFNTNWTYGTLSSPVIGPAQKWGSFHWRQYSLGGQDNISIKLIGIKADSSQTVLATFPKDSIDILNLGLYVNAAVYPNIRLVATMSDTLLHIPPQMKRWQVTYDPVPEGALDPLLGFYLSSDTLQIGQSVTIHTPFQNVSNIAFKDSLLFTYWSEDINGNNTYLPTKFKSKPLMPYHTIIDTLTVNTLNYQNTQALWVEVNPIHQHKSQSEQFHFNNIARIPVVIKSSNTNSLLDVTFDGVHILNNDIVSAKPDILVSLRSENKFLALNDTSDFKVFLQTAGSAVATEIYFGKEMTFTPAILPNNSCKINFTPTLSDGTYQLIVQAKDQSNNQSGYKINFAVINKSTITEVMNYPNPFSTSTKFVFTLTGSVIPTYFKIQIYNIEGKVVREINEDELGYIHIGRNITEYAWNGKDQFGDQLANGIYLYRVITSINGQTVQEQATGADQFFKHSFGKMYLLR